MPNPTRTLETDPRWLASATDEVVSSEEVVFRPIDFLRDAKAAHQLLDLVVLTACFLDHIEADDEVGGPLKIQAATLRDALAPWVPLPEPQAASIAYSAWLGRIMAFHFSVPQDAPPGPGGLSILRAELRDAILAQERAEEHLRLVMVDAEHLRAKLAGGIDG